MRNTIQFSKIPQSEKAKGAIASGRFAVFGGLLSVGPAMEFLNRQDKVPACGLVLVNGKQFYYCLVGFVDDPDIYEKV